MHNYQNQTPPPITRHHGLAAAVHLPPAPLHHALVAAAHHHSQHHSPHHPLAHHMAPVAAIAAVAAAAPPPLPLQPPPLPPPSTSSLSSQLQPLISNSLAIRQEIQRFESVHPSIYAIYDLIDLLPLSDAQIAQQIRDHVVCIEALTPEEHGLILNSQAKKAVKNLMQQMPCGWPEYGIPPLAPYTNADLEIHLAKSVVDSMLQMIRFRFDGLDEMKIKKLKVSYTFNKKVRYHFVFEKLKATAVTLNTDTFIDMLKQWGLTVRYEGSGPMEFALNNLELSGQFKYKMPWLWGSIKIYKFECVVKLGSVTSNIGGILGNGAFNTFINDEIEYQIPNFVNGHQKEISARIEQNLVPRVNAKLKGKKIWSLLGKLGSSNSKCNPTPAPWLAEL